MLFVLHDARDALDAFHHLGIGVAHVLGDEAGELIQIRIGDADHAGIAHGAAHDLAQHVAAAFVRGQHAVVDQKRGGAGVIGIDAQDGIGAIVFAVGLPEQFAGALDDGAEQVGIVVRKLALQDGGDALEAHAGIDGGRGSGVSLPPASRSNCMKTRFQISTKRSPASSGNARPGRRSGPRS